LALAVTVLFAQTAFADLVTNGGFEDGFNGWTLDQPAWTQIDDGTWAPYILPHTGKYYADFGSADADTPNIITQSLATTIGQSYKVSFWLANDGGTPANFYADFDGSHLTTLENPPAFLDWVQYSYTVTPSTSSSALTFTFYQVPGYFHLDDVSVSAVPLPGSLVLLASALLPLGWRRLRKG
jgi:hypothetical protein